jgi:hypothetical protein
VLNENAERSWRAWALSLVKRSTPAHGTVS